MGLKKVLLAYDGSAGGDKAATWLISFVGQMAVEIRIARVVDLPVEFIGDMPDLIDSVTRNAENSLSGVLRKFADGGLKAVTVALEGAPSSELIAYAEQEKVDLIICGSRGLGGFESLLLGSVAHQLVTHSPVPVLVVK